jgi:regulatory protein
MTQIERIEASGGQRRRVLVYLTDGACLKITEQELLDFGLRSGDELDEEMLKRLKEAAGVSNVKASAADLIGKRAMSRRDLERKLQEKGASEAEACYAAEWLEAIGAIDDADYAVLIVRHYGQLGYGPAYVRQKLYEKGVPRELWDVAMDALPDPAELIGRFLENKLRGELPDEKGKKKLTDTLLRRGFSWGDIRKGWNAYGTEIPEDC